MMIIEVIPFANFREKIKLTKELKGKVTILDNLIMVERKAGLYD